MNWKKSLGSIGEVKPGQMVTLMKEENDRIFWTTGNKGKSFEVVSSSDDDITVKVKLEDIKHYDEWSDDLEPDEEGIMHCSEEKSFFRLLE